MPTNLSHPDDATPSQCVQGGMDGGSSKKGSTTPRAPSVRRSRVPGTDPGTSENASQAEAKFLEPACPRGSGGAAGGVSGVEPGGCRLFQLAGWPRECLSDIDCDKAGEEEEARCMEKGTMAFFVFSIGFRVVFALLLPGRGYRFRRSRRFVTLPRARQTALRVCWRGREGRQPGVKSKLPFTLSGGQPRAFAPSERALPSFCKQPPLRSI